MVVSTKTTGSRKSWQEEMQDAAFKIAFPGEERFPGDAVSVTTSYHESEEGGYCGSCAYFEDAEFVITVQWTGMIDPTKPYQIQRPLKPFFRQKTFQNEEAEEFWIKLMKGSE